ncbi:MAG: uncharacterized protein KVP18_000480 [Porospora cf. gigantea A]|uniref:uncharacterized protein n=1 Tax=Porospora cf. gigantea A TaxID=2853593 RepID=UPI0035597621|nr:MAG: hypothetical protein KVP18_000480 [Porospora cf. gigantea A]
MSVLHLSKQIRNLAHLPILGLVYLSLLLRNMLALKSTGPQVKGDLIPVVAAAQLARSQNLRNQLNLLSPLSFEVHKAYLLSRSSPETAEDWKSLPISLNNPPPTKSLMDTISSSNQDPNMVANMMKGQMTFLFVNVGLGYLVSFLYTGFILAKVPFSLPLAFRGMLQRGIDVADLDVSYVSSSSWYFILLFGLPGAVTLVEYYLIGDLAMPSRSPMGDMSEFGSFFLGSALYAL